MAKGKNQKKYCVIAIVAVAVIVVLILVTAKVYGNRQHEYYCDKFLLTVDNKQIDLQEMNPLIQSVSELLPITNKEIAIVCRIDENTNFLMIYSFGKKNFVFQKTGTMLAWVQDDYNSTVYQDGDTVYDLQGKKIYQASSGSHIAVIEYIGSEFYVTVADENYENQEQVKVLSEE